jgi:hypothetical protein
VSDTRRRRPSSSSDSRGIKMRWDVRLMCAVVAVERQTSLIWVDVLLPGDLGRAVGACYGRRPLQRP